MTTYEQIFENNKKWVAEKKATDSEFFEKLAEGQDPDFLYIGCSDSRVPAEAIMGVQPGEVFVHRNIANVVSKNDLSSSTVIDFAVAHLNVKHIVVCGHYYCGGVKAAMQNNELSDLDPWLKGVRDVYRLHITELEIITDEDTRYRRLVELNVEEQCINVIKNAVVRKEYLKKGFPKVHGWVFDVRSGELIDLKIDFKTKLKDIQDIYNLKSSD